MLKFKIERMIEDGLDMIELVWEESNESKSLVVDWNQDEEEDIDLRARFILTYIDDWLKKKRKGIFNEPSLGWFLFLNHLHLTSNFHLLL